VNPSDLAPIFEIYRELYYFVSRSLLIFLGSMLTLCLCSTSCINGAGGIGYQADSVDLIGFGPLQSLERASKVTKERGLCRK